MSAILYTIDEELEARGHEVERQTGVLRAARALREQLEAERQGARGRLGGGDTTAGPDLERLRAAVLAVRRTVQGAEAAVAEAKARRLPLQVERARAERHEVASALAGVLAVRAALAQQLEAEMAQLAATVRLYAAAVEESVGLAALAGAVLRSSMNPYVSRRLLAVLRPALPREFTPGSGPEPPLPESDASLTQAAREAIARALPATAPRSAS